MPLRTRDQLKEYFQTGDFPTEAQFADLIDSLLHQGDTLNGANIRIGGVLLVQYLNDYFFQNLPTVTELDNEAGNLAVDPLQTLYAIQLLADADMTVSIGTTVGGDEVASIDLLAGQRTWLNVTWVNQHPTLGALLHVSGATGLLKLACYYRNNPF